MNELHTMFTDKLQSKNLSELLDVVLALRGTVKRISDVLKDEKASLQQAEAALISAMIDAQQKSFKNEDGVSVSRRKVNHYSVTAEKRENLFHWLRLHDAGDLIKEQVHPRTLEAYCREHMEQGGCLPDFIKDYEEDRLVIRGR